MNIRLLSDGLSGACSSLEDSAFTFDEQQLHRAPPSQRRTSVSCAGGQEMEMYTNPRSISDEAMPNVVRPSSETRDELRSRRSASASIATTRRTATTTTSSSSSSAPSETDVPSVENDLFGKNGVYGGDLMISRQFVGTLSNLSDSSMDWTISYGQQSLQQLLGVRNELRDVDGEGYRQEAQQKTDDGKTGILHDLFRQKQKMLPSSNEKDGHSSGTDMFAVPVQEQCAEVAGGTQPAVEGERESDAFLSREASNERMMFYRPVDPRNLIINVIINSAPGSVTLQTIHNALQWDKNFEKAYGSVFDYLQGYHSIFAVSPIDDRVTLRRPLQTVKGRRSVRGQRGYHAISSRIGSISCSYVATAFDLDMFSTIYKRRGYEVELIYDVLHVFSQRVFDLFLFSNGVVVWWGLNRPDHWVVDDDFFSSAHSFVREAVKEPHDQTTINDLFPFWCSYELDEHYDSSTASFRDEALKRFATNLCFDHYLIPEVEPIRTQIMLTVSYSLGRTAIVDFFDLVTQGLQKKVLSMSSGIKSVSGYFSARCEIARIEGELQLARMATMAIRDTPEFLWEMAWLYDYYALAESQNCSAQLLSWFMAKSDALLQQLASIKTRRFRLFMLGSDVFLIFLLVIDVIFLMSSFVLQLYFPLEEQD